MHSATTLPVRGPLPVHVTPAVSATLSFKGLPALSQAARDAIDEADDATLGKLLVHDATHVVGAADLDGRTALHRAAAKGDLAIVRALVNAGADVRATDVKLRTALHGAVKGGHVDTVEFLLLKVCGVCGPGGRGVGTAVADSRGLVSSPQRRPL